MGKREDKIHQTRSRLLSIADRMIAEHGYEEVSVDQIVAACGIAKGTFYNYYESKAALITALSQQHFRQVTDITDTYASKAPVEAMGQYLTEYMQVIKDAGIGLARQWVRYISSAAGNTGKWDQDVSNITSLLEKLIASGSLKKATPVQELAELSMTQLYGAVLTWTILGENFQPVKNIQHVCRDFLPSVLEPYVVAPPYVKAFKSHSCS
ncbi:TetR/AcrR family transcriptional regulator [Bombiscardovia coagulans]|uniref:TetR family transcriptional regulator n=1 Tax=Bombiscardovia coagulans TaxID=686666 RepID=A0A261EU11_9BIFI|nr:TetR/AcrR family transcriptional regulator [Bombiscardovia coagulans]OZG50343.1 tetR family transcriptional regulator [Bombiscardovia coagulans]